MHLAMSMSKRRQHHRLGLRVLLRIDHDAVDRTGALARQTAGADLEIDLENPAVAKGQLSCTRIGMRSGYWIVIGLRMKCENVTAMPSKIVVQVSVMLRR